MNPGCALPPSPYPFQTKPPTHSSHPNELPVQLPDMYLTITTTHSPATDLGYRLNKRPASLIPSPSPCRSPRRLIQRPQIRAAPQPCCSKSILSNLSANPAGLPAKAVCWTNTSTIALTYLLPSPVLRWPAPLVPRSAAAVKRSKTLPMPNSHWKFALPFFLAVAEKFFYIGCLSRLMYAVAASRHPLDEKFLEFGARVGIGVSFFLPKNDCKMFSNISMCSSQCSTMTSIIGLARTK